MVVVLAWTFATNIVDAFGAISTWAGLMFLLVYLFVPLAAGRALWGPTVKERIKAMVVPFVVFAVVGFVLFKSAWPLPTGYLAIVPWLALGVTAMSVIVALTRRAADQTGTKIRSS